MGTRSAGILNCYWRASTKTGTVFKLQYLCRFCFCKIFYSPCNLTYDWKSSQFFFCIFPLSDSDAVHRCFYTKQQTGPRHAVDGLSPRLLGLLSAHAAVLATRRWTTSLPLPTLHSHHGKSVEKKSDELGKKQNFL